MLDWIINNKEWLFSGAGIAILAMIVKRKRSSTTQASSTQSTELNLTQNFISSEIKEEGTVRNQGLTDSEIDKLKGRLNILFIDDEPEFKVVSILKKSGWINTQSILDAEQIDHPQIKNAHILFIDIQGVGKMLGFKNEGLGLAQAIKQRYPFKKVVIYSAQKRGDRFDPAFDICDGRLSKNAEPYQFQSLTEKLAASISEEL